MVVIKEVNLEAWKPKTDLGKKVKLGEISSMDEILDKGYKVLEPEIIDMLVPNLTVELLEVGQSKGKFGGGKPSIWKQTQKTTKEGKAITFSTCAVVGNHDGFVGIGYGSAKETVPAREKAIRSAKLSLIKIRRGCGSWECGCGTGHSLPFNVNGKTGSLKVKLMPAPRGTGLKVEKQCSKILKLVGLEDVYSKTKGHTATKLNLVRALFDSLKQSTKTKLNQDHVKELGVIEGNGNV